MDFARRRAGLSRTPARHALTDGVRAGRRKVVVELTADQEPAIAMFGSLGFAGKARCAITPAIARTTFAT